MKMKTRAFIGVLTFSAFVLFSGCGQRTLEKQLIIASQDGNVQEIKRLLSLGVNVNCKQRFSPDAGTPLIWAVRCRQEKAVEVLLAAGADPNIKTRTGQTALFQAIGGYQEDNSRIIKDLILAGANTDEDKKGFESLWPDNTNRVAFEQAIIIRNQSVTNHP
jgi:ankyrin repeat protein